MFQNDSYYIVSYESVFKKIKTSFYEVIMELRVTENDFSLWSSLKKFKS